MRIGLKTSLAMLAVATLPLAVGSLSALGVAQDALRSRSNHHHAAVARFLAEQVHDELMSHRLATVRAAGTYQFEAMTDAERIGALRLVFRQIPGASAVVLVDDEGVAAVPPIYLEVPVDRGDLSTRKISTAEDVARFAEHIQLSAAKVVGAAMSPPYRDDEGRPRLSVAAVTGDGFVLAVELELSALGQIIGRDWLGLEGRAAAVDANGFVVLDSGTDDTIIEWAALATNDAAGVFEHPAGRLLGTTAPVAGYGWRIVVVEPERVALSAVFEARDASLRWALVALGAGLVLGLLLTRTLTGPVKALHAGAVALGGGDLGHRVAGAERSDELGDLSRAFNTMAEEIQAWNAELESRVETKSRQLRDAQELLLRAQNLAAVGQLGAGVAHEINNPLAALLASAQLLLRREKEDSPRRELLTTVEAQASRIRDIIENLRRVVEDQEVGEIETVDFADTVDRSLLAVKSAFDRSDVEVVRRFEAVDCDVVGNTEALCQAFKHILDNARIATPSGGRVTVAIQQPADALVSVRFEDTGAGIEDELRPRIFEPFFTTKTEWDSKGLGLSIVSRIVADHRGEVRVDSTPGHGAAFTVTLPCKPRRTLA